MPAKKKSIQSLETVKQSKAERLAEAVSDAVDAGEFARIDTVDFSDPARPKTCLEVDFPILPVNQVAVIEGNASKPIYQLSKWWARRRSSVFRSLLLSAATRAPDDPTEAAKAVWDNYYKNHQKLGALKHLKVADIFMGGGTTLVEGSRLGMQMFGNDLNPVAWFVVKTELARVKREEVEALLADIEAEVKPQIMPFYACDGPNGERGTWTRVADGKVMGEKFDPLALKPEERKDYRYEGPEAIYVFWAKHGPCQRTGCGHRTPIFSSPVIAVKTISVKAWPCTCEDCGAKFDIEEVEARMAPDAPLVVAGRGSRAAAKSRRVPGNRPKDRHGGGHRTSEISLRLSSMRHGPGRTRYSEGIGQEWASRGVRCAGLQPGPRPRGRGLRWPLLRGHGQHGTVRRRTARMGDEEEDRPKGLLAAQRAPVRVHDPYAQRGDPESWLHTLVDHVQSASVAGPRVAAESHRPGQRGRTPMGGPRVRTGGVSAVPAQSVHVLVLASLS